MLNLFFPIFLLGPLRQSINFNRKLCLSNKSMGLIQQKSIWGSFYFFFPLEPGKIGFETTLQSVGRGDFWALRHQRTLESRWERKYKTPVQG